MMGAKCTLLCPSYCMVLQYHEGSWLDILARVLVTRFTVNIVVIELAIYCSCYSDTRQNLLI